MPRTLQLVVPSLALLDSFRAMRDACTASGEDPWSGRNELAYHDVAAFIALLQLRAEGREIPKGWVPERTFWIVLDEQSVVGEVELRHPLNDWLRQVGGNIGYLTHPHYRGQGIATFGLGSGLRQLAGMGLDEALVTCRDDNASSIRVIEKCGGVRTEDAKIDGPLRRRYLVDLRPFTSR